MSTRYAILFTNDDGQEIVSEVKQIEGSAPDVPKGYKAVEVSDGVLIGMVKGGKKDAVGDYGFPDGSEGAAERSEVGVTTAEDSPPRAKAPKGKAKATASSNA